MITFCDVVIYVYAQNTLFIDCLAEEKKTANIRKFVPIGEDEVRESLAYHMDQLSADERRGLLVFLNSIFKK